MAEVAALPLVLGSGSAHLRETSSRSCASILVRSRASFSMAAFRSELIVASLSQATATASHHSIVGSGDGPPTWVAHAPQNISHCLQPPIAFVEIHSDLLDEGRRNVRLRIHFACLDRRDRSRRQRGRFWSGRRRTLSQHEELRLKQARQVAVGLALDFALSFFAAPFSHRIAERLTERCRRVRLRGCSTIERSSTWIASFCRTSCLHFTRNLRFLVNQRFQRAQRVPRTKRPQPRTIAASAGGSAPQRRRSLRCSTAANSCTRMLLSSSCSRTARIGDKPSGASHVAASPPLSASGVVDGPADTLTARAVAVIARCRGWFGSEKRWCSLRRQTEG